MNKKYFNLLDSILLSENVVENFYCQFRENTGFRNWLKEEIPAVEECEKQQQNNPWHIYNVLGHILHSVEEMNKQTLEFDRQTRRMLAYTMFFHDIGKPEKHICRMKDGKMIDSFFNHNQASEKIAAKILPRLNFSKEEIKIIKKLVFKHDIFMFIKPFESENPHWRTLSQKLIKEELRDMQDCGDGETMLRWLILVGRCDNLAQNPKMAAEALKLLELFEKELNKFLNVKRREEQEDGAKKEIPTIY